MTKPREFWVAIAYNGDTYVSADKKHGMKNSQVLADYIKVREVVASAPEVVPIDWEKVWNEYNNKQNCQVWDEDRKVIQQLVEKQLVESQRNTEHERALKIIEKYRELIREADSYLSLVYHRHSSELPGDLREEIGKSYSKMRQALDYFPEVNDE